MRDAASFDDASFYFCDPDNEMEPLSRGLSSSSTSSSTSTAVAVPPPPTSTNYYEFTLPNELHQHVNFGGLSPISSGSHFPQSPKKGSGLSSSSSRCGHVGKTRSQNEILNARYYWENVLAEDETSSFCGSLEYSLNSYSHVDVTYPTVVDDESDGCTRDDEILYVQCQPHREAGDCFRLPLEWVARSLEVLFG